MRSILFYEVKVLIHPPVRPCSHTPVSVLTHLHTPVSNPIFNPVIILVKCGGGDSGAVQGEGLGLQGSGEGRGYTFDIWGGGWGVGVGWDNPYTHSILYL